MFIYVTSQGLDLSLNQTFKTPEQRSCLTELPCKFMIAASYHIKCLEKKTNLLIYICT